MFLWGLFFRLYKERLSQVDIKLQEVMAGCAQEYLEPLANLQENMQIRTKVAGELKQYYRLWFDNLHACLCLIQSLIWNDLIKWIFNNSLINILWFSERSCLN